MDKSPVPSQKPQPQQPSSDLHPSGPQGICISGPMGQSQSLKGQKFPKTEVQKKRTQQKGKLSMEQKYKLKQQSRDLLLKQCYKMAMNKYLRLIKEGSEGFSQRQWSVIHLNTGIAMQYQDRLTQSLEKISEAIKIDKTYQKPYYRRLLILQELGQFQLIMSSDNIVPYFIKNEEVKNLREQICERYRKSIGFDYLINRIQLMDFNHTATDQTVKFVRLVKDIHKSSFIRIIQQIQAKCKKTEKTENTEEFSNAFEIGQKIGQYYKILKQKQGTIPSKGISQIIQSLYQQIYGLSIKYLHLTFDKKNNSKIRALIRFLFSFWKFFSQLMMEKQQEMCECLGNSIREYVIMYCPFALFSMGQLVLIIKGLLDRVSKGQPAQAEKLYIKTIKIAENNLLLIQVYNEKVIMELPVRQFQSSSQLLDLIKKYISQIVESKSTQILQDYKQKTILSDVLLNLYECLKKVSRGKSKSGSYMYKDQHQQQFVELYLARHSLKMDAIQQKKEKISLILQKLDRFIKKQKNRQIGLIRTNRIYTVYETLQRLQPQLYKHQASRSDQQLIESIQKLSNYFNQVISEQENISCLRSTLSNPHSLNSFEILIKWLLSLSILGQLSPTFCMKRMQAYKCKAANTDSLNSELNNSLGELLQKLSNVSNIMLWVWKKGGKEQNTKQIIKIYVQVLTLLSISNPIFLNHILVSPPTISKIFLVFYPNKKDTPLKPNSCEPLPLSLASENSHQLNILQIQALPTLIKLLYNLIVDVGQQQQQQYAQRMGVGKEQIKKAKQLQGQNRYPDIIESINQRRITLKLVMTGKQQVLGMDINKTDRGQFSDPIQNISVDHNTWSQIIHQIIHMLNNVEVEQYEIEDKMMAGIIFNLTECQPKKFHSLEIMNWMLNKFNKYHPSDIISKEKLSSTSPHFKVGYQIAKYFSKIIKKINVSTLTYTQLQPIANILMHLVENAKHELQIFESFLSLINLSVKNITIPLEIIFLGCTENNQYIVHGALELFNNILVNTEFQNKIENVGQDKQKAKFWTKFKQIEEMVYKYYRYYRHSIDEQKNQRSIAVNTNDYSHPYKIYCTLLSVLLVLRSLAISFKEQNVASVCQPECPEIQEFISWKQAYRHLHLIEGNRGDISITLFKLVLHHVENGTLPNGWHIGLEKAIDKLKDTDRDKWAKIQKYVK